MNALEACWQARRAWERHDHQLVMDVDGLDGEQPRALLSVEPAVPPRSLPGGGLESPSRESTMLARVSEDAELRKSAREFIAQSSVRDEQTGCLIWQGPMADGYGRPRFDGEKVQAPRLSYVSHVGPIAPGLVIDHLCRNRACVNPSHLELVTNRENVLRGDGLTAVHARKTHCNHGHLLDGDNVILSTGRYGRHWRRCRTCYEIANRTPRPERYSNRNRSESAGLTVGAEPCRDLLGTDGESALVTAAPVSSGASAPLTHTTGAGRRSPQGKHGRRQEVTS